MSNLYDSNMILEILRIFKVKNVVLSNVADKGLIEDIKGSDFNVALINVEGEDSIEGNPLDVLPDLDNYDAIFIDGDANWYTVFNELNVVKKSNDEFPLTFICNNNFPNKRRDSYMDPEAIPPEFRQEYVKELPIRYNYETINIIDEYYHACEENTPKNGVLTAIEDFLGENSYISEMKINSIDGITILYPKLQINEKRVKILKSKLEDEKGGEISLSDKLIENDLLVSHISKYNDYGENFIRYEDELSKKDNLILNYEKEIKLKNSEVNFKDSQLKSIESKLSLKDSQIKSAESKLINNEKRIGDLEGQLRSASEDYSKKESSFNDRIGDLEGQLRSASEDYSKKESSFNDRIGDLESQLKSANSDYSKKIVSLEGQLKSANIDFSQKETSFNSRIISLENKLNRSQNEFETLSSDIKQKDDQLKLKQKELNDAENRLDSLQHSYNRQLSKMDSDKYCISCFKEEISNNHMEIKYLKNNTVIKKILSPVAYLYLVLKSHPKDLSLNISLYKALKDSKCFDIGFYLNRNKDLIDSKWCKYFSPELHYVCEGFKEDRLFNKKYFNRNSKKELLDYLLTCDK